MDLPRIVDMLSVESGVGLTEGKNPNAVDTCVDQHVTKPGRQKSCRIRRVHPHSKVITGVHLHQNTENQQTTPASSPNSKIRGAAAAVAP